VPRTAQELALAAELIRTRLTSFNEADDSSLAQRCAVVRASISDGKILAVDVEYPDFPARDRYKKPLSGGHLVDGGNDMTGHLSNP
jgi:hypothetical protein